jgi:hypothetical protein
MPMFVNSNAVARPLDGSILSQGTLFISCIHGSYTPTVQQWNLLIIRTINKPPAHVFKLGIQQAHTSHSQSRAQFPVFTPTLRVFVRVGKSTLPFRLRS